jgi:hypothetical protein
LNRAILCIDPHPKPLKYKFHSRQSKSGHFAVSFSLGFGDRPFENIPVQNFAAMCVEERTLPFCLFSFLLRALVPQPTGSK